MVGSRLAVGSHDGTVRVLQLFSDSDRARWTGAQELVRWVHEDKVLQIGFDHSGSWIAVLKESGAVRILATSGAEVLRWTPAKPKAGAVRTFAFTPAQNPMWLALGAADGAVRTIDLVAYSRALIWPLGRVLWRAQSSGVHRFFSRLTPEVLRKICSYLVICQQALDLPQVG
ncbi:unnamed protein product [Polarella glacialis]|nr:unnamed protein product [Polarella glacialis]